MKLLFLTDAPKPTPFDLDDDVLDTLGRAAGRDALAQASEHGVAVTGLVDSVITKADSRELLSELERTRRARMKALLPRGERLLATSLEIRIALIDWEFDLDIRKPEEPGPLDVYDAIVMDAGRSWLDVAQRIAAACSQRATPVFALVDGPLNEISSVRAVEVLRKPISGMVLYAKIVDAVDRRTGAAHAVGQGAAVA